MGEARWRSRRRGRANWSATVYALTTQIALGRDFATVMIGPVIAGIAVLAFYILQGGASQK